MAERLTVYYRTLEKLFSPDLIVVGGGVSKDSAEFLPLIDIETEIVPATLENRAGIVGAALWAAEAGDEQADYSAANAFSMSSRRSAGAVSGLKRSIT